MPRYVGPGSPGIQEAPRISPAREANQVAQLTARYAPTPPPPSGGGGGGGGDQAPTASSGGGSSSRSSSVSPPSPMKDVDWFAKDAEYRAARAGLGADLQDTLAQILFDRQNRYRNLDNAQRMWEQSRSEDTMNLGENFAARGLGSSGLYKQGLDDLMAQYEAQQADITAQQQATAQEYGARGNLDQYLSPEGGGRLDEGALFDKDYNALASIYGLLGSRGTQAGSGYGGRLNQERAQSAGRAGRSIINTLGW